MKLMDKDLIEEFISVPGNFENEFIIIKKDDEEIKRTTEE